MSKVKILKVSDDITTKDIAIPVLLYLETSKNYSVKIKETDNNFSLDCQSKGFLKNVIAMSVKFELQLKRNDDKLLICFDKFNWIYKTIYLIIGVIFCFIHDFSRLGIFLTVTSILGFWLYLWHKLLIYLYIKKCIKKKSEVLTENMLSSFSSYLKVIELYKTEQECEEKLLSLKKCKANKAIEKIGEVAEETVIEPESNRLLKQKIKKPINKEKIKKIIQFIIGVILILGIATIYFKYKQKTATHASEPQNIEKSNVNDCK
ncbi:MAG: hypothetical protein E7054_09680 [Lentisphaerae bacterium]|nr:hypothetical protein [Lentisphaerota bacterium]